MTDISTKTMSFLGLYRRVLKEGLALPAQKQKFLALACASSIAGFCETSVVLAISKLFQSLAIGTTDASGSAPATWLRGVIRSTAQTFSLTEEVVTTIGGIGICAVLLVTSILLLYVAAVLSRSMARRYHVALMSRIFSKVTETNDPQLLLHIEGMTPVQMSVMQHAIHTSKSLESLALLFQTGTFVVLFMWTAFFIDQKLMSIILASMVVFAPVVLFMARRIHRSAGDFFSSGARGMGSKLTMALRHAEYSILPGFIAPEAKKLFETPEARAYLDGYDSIQLAHARMAMLTGFVRVLLLTFGLAVMAYAFSHSDRSVSTVVALATTLLLLLRYLQNFFSEVASLNIYYPQVAAYFELIDDLDRSVTVASDNHIASRKFEIAKPDRPEEPGELYSIDVPLGDAVEIVSRTTLSRFDIAKWYTPLERSSAEPFAISQIAMLSELKGDRDGTDYSDVHSDARIEAGLKARGFGTLKELAKELDIPWDESSADGYPKADPVFNAFLGVASVLALGAQEIFVEKALLIKLPKSALDKLKPLFKSARLYIRRTPTEHGTGLADHCLVVHNGSVAAMFGAKTDIKVIMKFCPAEDSRAAAAAAAASGIEAIM